LGDLRLMLLLYVLDRRLILERFESLSLRQPVSREITISPLSGE
jgi:hypothetical protein